MDGNKNINLENLSDFKKNIDNVIDTSIKSFKLPIATAETLGGIKPDNNTNFVDEDGVLRVVGSLDKIMLVPSTNDSFTYDGTEHSPVWQNYDKDMLDIGGETSGTNAGIYTTTFTPKEEYVWGDGVKKAKSVSWNIKGISIEIPTKNGNLAYTGSEQSPTWENYDSEKMTISGIISATEVGTYTAIFTPMENYQWSDGTNTTKSISWSIGRAIIDLPTQNGTLTYNGIELSPSWSGYDDTKLTLGGVIVGINAGSYTATFVPNENYAWSDGTTEEKSVNWAIGRASIVAPSQKESLTYTGSEQSPTWENYDSEKMTISGATVGVNASSYTAIFTPQSNYQWADGSISDKIVTWSIGRASGYLALSKSSVTLDMSTLTTTVKAAKIGDGTITATSTNTNIATVSVSNTTITITAKGNGSTTITVYVGAGTNYKATSKIINVTSNIVSSVLNDCTPEEIQQAARSGIAPDIWDVGDTINITLNGTIHGGNSYNLTFDNDICFAFIIGFNHNNSIEGNNTIHFSFSSGFYSYSSISSCGGFPINQSKTIDGGWKNSYIRTTTCSDFLNVLPTAWKNVIVSCTKYTDNNGKSSDASNITATSDKIWLMSEFEVAGVQNRANNAEQNYQKQYAYYKNGNSRVKYCKYNNTNRNIHWWLRSPDSVDYLSSGWCLVCANGTLSSTPVNNQEQVCFVPCFMVA